MNDFSSKLNTLSLGEKLVAGGGVLMLIASFFSWWHYSAPSGLGVGGFSQSGWDAPGSIWSVLAILVSMGLAAVIFLSRFANITMPALPENVTWGKVYGGGGAAVVVLMLLKAWRISSAPIGGFGTGFIIGLIAAGAVAAGCYLLYTEEKTGVKR